jgi:uncharacterized protein with NRDE domain
MCTLLILFRPKEKWPLIIAGNRDEILDRPWISPGKHWPAYPNIIAGKDLTAGGSWLGINKTGLVATILNRKNSLGPSNDKFSRGEIIINVLKNNDINKALAYLKTIDNSKWKPFNLFIANSNSAYWIKNIGKEKIIINPILEGKYFLDSHDINSKLSDRYIYNKDTFQSLKNPNPEKSEWEEWINFLSQTNCPNNKPMAAMNIKNKYINNYGTMSSAIIAIPSDVMKNKNNNTIFLFNNSSPDKNKFYAINTC